MYKGQATIEFLAAMILFLIVIISSVTLISGDIPEFRDDLKESNKNLEIYSLTQRILTTPGYHNNQSGGTEWEDNIRSTQEMGLATEHLVLEKEKIDALQTTGKNKFNYTQFRNLNDLNNQYNFEFTWYPIVETSNSFTREYSPGFITGPEETDSDYNNAENRVHYGTFTINSNNYRFLVTAHNGVYDTVRISPNWNFEAKTKLNIGDTYLIEDNNFTIERIQNRERKPGASVVLKNELKSFGPSSEGVSQSVTKLNRYAAMKAPGTDTEPVRVEVLAW